MSSTAHDERLVDQVDVPLDSATAGRIPPRPQQIVDAERVVAAAERRAKVRLWLLLAGSAVCWFAGGIGATLTWIGVQ